MEAALEAGAEDISRDAENNWHYFFLTLTAILFGTISRTGSPDRFFIFTGR